MGAVERGVGRPVRIDKADDLVLAAAREEWARNPEKMPPTVDAERAPEWFHPYQKEAWDSDKPIIAVCAGWQSGKTVFLPPWLLREIQRKGPGDYGAFSSTFKLLKRKFLPELKKQFKPYAVYHISDMQFVFTDEGSRALWGSDWDGSETVIQLGHAENPDSLESATMKAIAWDEPGQRLVPEQSFRTVQSRLMVNRGRMCLSSRPYEFNWFERLVSRGNAGDPDIKVVSFPSWANPVNPQEEDEHWDKLRAELAEWQFQMLYEGVFTKPAGVIYDCFDTKTHVVTQFPIPDHWPRYVGVDFGGVNHCAVFLAEGDDGTLYVYDTYLPKKAQEIGDRVQAIKERIKARQAFAAGGSHQEVEARAAYGLAGLPVAEPAITDVFAGIEVVYAQVKLGKLKVFSHLDRLIHEFQTYTRELDDEDEPIDDKIADKAKFHRLDALRGIVTTLRGRGTAGVRRTSRLKKQHRRRT